MAEYIEKIKITKKNESFVYIDADSGILMEISEHFCFFAPGYKWMPAFKNKIWDGKIRLFNSHDQTLPQGLVYLLPEFVKVRGYTLELGNNPNYGYVGEKEVFGNINDFIDSIPLTDNNGNDIYPYDYQISAVATALEDRSRLLLSPTASGKSLIIYLILRYYLRNYHKKVLIVVPTTSLVEQMTQDFIDYSSKDSNFSGDDIHKIYSGKEKYNIEPDVVITTWQSIYKMGQKWFQMFGAVIGDEAHTFKAKSLNTIMASLTEAKFRIGTTGTLDGEHCNTLTLEGHFGRVHRVITTKELMEKGTISKLKINAILLSHKHEDRVACKNMTYPEEIDFLVGHKKRNTFITNLACSLKGNTIVLYKLVKKHGEPLFRQIQEEVEANHPNKKVYFVSGGTKVDQREDIRRLAEVESGCIIVASLGTFSTGINIKNLHNVIFASPNKSVIKVLQSIGRVLRIADDGSEATLYDIIDDLSVPNRKKQNFALQHGSVRMNIYIKEEFDYKVWKIKL